MLRVVDAGVDQHRRWRCHGHVHQVVLLVVFVTICACIHVVVAAAATVIVMPHLLVMQVLSGRVGDNMGVVWKLKRLMSLLE